MGNPDVPIREEGGPSIPGKGATGKLKAQENHKERLQGWNNDSRRDEGKRVP